MFDMAVEWAGLGVCKNVVILGQTVLEIYEPLTLWWTKNDDDERLRTQVIT